MRRSPLFVAALACLLAASGCLGVFGGEAAPDPTAAEPDGRGVSPTAPPSSTAPLPSTASPSPAGTPTPTPTATPVPSAISLPDGVNATGIGSPERIAAAHNATLRNTSFTVRYVSVEAERGSVETYVVGRVRYDGEGTLYSNYTATEFGDGPPSRQRVQLWSNGSTAFRRIVTENGTTVVEMAPIPTAPTFADRIELFLRSFKMRKTGWSRVEGKSVVRVSGNALDSTRGGTNPLQERAFQFGFRAITGGSFSADLADGVLRRYRVRLVGVWGGRSKRLTTELVYTEVGTTTVDRPAWIAAANETRSAGSRSAYQPRSRTPG